MKQQWLGLSVASTLAFCIPTASLAMSFVAKDLGVLPGTNVTWAYDINDSGQAIGWAGQNVRWPVTWDSKGNISAVGTQTGSNARAEAINNNGQVVGHTDSGGFIWSQNDGYTNLGWGQTPLDINDNGWFVGSRSQRATLWDPDNKPYDLGTLPNYIYSMAWGINSQGVVVGDSYSQTFYEQAFVWTQAAGMVRLNGLGGRETHARDINGVGQIVGRGQDTKYNACAILWDSAGAPMKLESLYYKYYDNTHAISINDLGMIAGASNDQPVIWEAGTHKINALPLPDGWIGGEAIGINNLGQVVGYARSATDPMVSHPFIWTPVPEPSSCLALLSGLGVFGYIAKRPRR